MREYEAEFNARDGVTIETATEEYEVYLRDEKNNKARSIVDTIWRVGKFFTDGDEQVSGISAKRAQALYDDLVARPMVDQKGKPIRQRDAHGEDVTDDDGEPVFKTMAPSSHRNILAECKTFARWWVDQRWVRVSPLEGIKGTGRRGKRRNQQLRLDEARRWWTFAIGFAEKGESGAVAALLTLCNLRASEIIKRTARDLDDAGTVLHIEDTKTEAGERRLAIPDEIRPFLVELKRGKKPTDLLFGEHWRDWPREWVQRICKASGVPKVTAHGMRRLHSSIAIEAGMSPMVVAAAMGHESETTTLGAYARPGSLDNARQRRMVDVLTDREGGE